MIDPLVDTVGQDLTQTPTGAADDEVSTEPEVEREDVADKVAADQSVAGGSGRISYGHLLLHGQILEVHLQRIRSCRVRDFVPRHFTGQFLVFILTKITAFCHTHPSTFICPLQWD